MTVGTLMDILGGIDRDLRIGSVSATEIEVVDANDALV